MVYTEEKEPIEIPDILPLLPVRDIVIFTHMFLPLYVGRESSIVAVDEALAKDRLICLSTQKDPNDDNPKPSDIYSLGTVAMIMKKFKLPDGRVKILVQGLVKATIEEYVRSEPCFQVKIHQLPDPPVSEISSETEALMRNVKEQCEKILSLKGLISTEIIEILDSVNDPGRLADLVASNLRLKIEASQQLLELCNPIERLQKVNEHLAKELEVSTMQAKIQSQAKEEMTKTQREYFLREQLRAIKSELGDIDEKTAEINEFSQKINPKFKIPNSK